MTQLHPILILSTFWGLLSLNSQCSAFNVDNGSYTKRRSVAKIFRSSKNNNAPKFTSAESSKRWMSGSGNNNSENDDDNDISHPMTQTSRLSHMMIKVPSVDETVQYWTDTMDGKVLVSRSEDGEINKDNNSSSNEPAMGTANGESYTKLSNLKSAFVALGNGKVVDRNKSFALEIVKGGDFELGNIFQYIGISMLMKFNKNKNFAVEDLFNKKSKTTTVDDDDKKQTKDGDDEPNGIPVQYCASAPGDYICRICFKSNNLAATEEFYTNILGMSIKAQDDIMLCLRYDSDDDNTYGVRTTLVFENRQQDDEDSKDHLVMGTCFDHLAIDTKLNISKLHETIKAQKSQGEGDSANKKLDFNIFMNPTDMFGKTVMGIIDPNGYKVVIAGE